MVPIVESLQKSKLLDAQSCNLVLAKSLNCMIKRKPKVIYCQASFNRK